MERTFNTICAKAGVTPEVKEVFEEVIQVARSNFRYDQSYWSELTDRLINKTAVSDLKAYILDPINLPFPDSLADAGGDKKFEALVKIMKEDGDFYRDRVSIIEDYLLEYLKDCGDNFGWFVNTDWPYIMNDVARSFIG